MSEIARRLNQCKKPEGDLGKVVVDDMNESHYELTGWGLNKVKIDTDSVILDIGCGGGKTINRLASIAKSGKIFGIDYSVDCVKWSKQYNRDLIDKEQVNIINASVEKLPFEDSKFDIVTAVETIYFWPNLVKNLKEIKRVLKDKGKLVIINEIYKDQNFEERNNNYVKNCNMKIYTPNELKKLLEMAGYQDIQMELKEEKNWVCYIAQK
ncbi:class I SAM-dependent methyltransferase [Clostridium sp. JN-1]|jgi:SAM-dependent methyltransferase|uniref:class I SAM-dependent methyltransferase n=1 Tax=Clostridium sp. JN-1 TaxID=2483110 RepID=UPI000F0B0609|nr:class I SAM-dependent methyltransferase [Clostridium sp. JN-1]